MTTWEVQAEKIAIRQAIKAAANRKAPRCLRCMDYHRHTISCEQLAAIRDAEIAAGWDPNP